MEAVKINFIKSRPLSKHLLTILCDKIGGLPKAFLLQA